MRIRAVWAVAGGVLVLPALAQTDIGPAHKFAWGENVGWLNFADANDWLEGIIVEPSYLAGFIWGENIGWVNFDNRACLGPFGQQARVDLDAERFRGYARGENVGWINLDDDEHFVSFGSCAGDFDGDVHKYFSPYDSPYDRYINFMNVLDNVRQRAGA